MNRGICPLVSKPRKYSSLWLGRINANAHGYHGKNNARVSNQQPSSVAFILTSWSIWEKFIFQKPESYSSCAWRMLDASRVYMFLWNPHNELKFFSIHEANSSLKNTWRRSFANMEEIARVSHKNEWLNRCITCSVSYSFRTVGRKWTAFYE